MSFKIDRFPFFSQLEANDCGPTCIQMIASYYKKRIPLEQIKEFCGISRLGITTLDLIECLKYIGFETAVVSISLNELQMMPLPAILHWRKDHFVVIYKIEKNKYYIADPAYGKIKLPEEQFVQSWLNNRQTGIAVPMSPTEKLDTFVVNNGIEKKNINKKILNLFYAIFKRNTKSVIIASLLLLISIILNWTMPIILQKIIDEGVMLQNMGIVCKFMLLQLCFFCGYTISDSLSSILLTKINFNESVKYLSEYLYKLVKLPISFFDTRLNTDLIQRMEDQERVQTFLTYRFLDLFFAFINLLVFSTILIYFSASTFIIFLILSILSILWTLLFLKKRKKLDYNRFYIASQNRNNIYEMIFGMPEIKINNAHNVRISKWSQLQKGMNEITLKGLYLNFYQLIGSSFINRLRDIFITGLCAYLVIYEDMTLGVMMTISYVLGQLSAPISQLIQFTQTFQDAVNSLDRLNEIQQKKEENSNDEIPILNLQAGFLIDHISFKYVKHSPSYVIDDLSLYIPKGKKTAIVGTSGSGKTTLIKLLLSFYTPQKGEIKIDNLPLTKINTDSLRNICGVVMQDGYIFSGTIAENIALHEDEPNMERLENAVKIACLYDFIKELPMGYDTPIGSSGIDLSGGQKQRLLIARAVYKDPEIIIFDEATSSLDANNETLILNNLSSFFNQRTVIVIAHRLSTVRNADNIIVMEHGKIVEQGTHQYLSSIKGKYYNLVKNQLELGV